MNLAKFRGKKFLYVPIYLNIIIFHHTAISVKYKNASFKWHKKLRLNLKTCILSSLSQSNKFFTCRENNSPTFAYVVVPVELTISMLEENLEITVGFSLMASPQHSGAEGKIDTGKY